MANIGYIARNDKGALVGKIETLSFTNVVGLRPVQSQNPNAPKYDVMALAADRRTWVKIGAAFEHFSKSTGAAFYQATVDDPSLAAPMSIAFFSNDENGYNIAWTRRRARRELGSAEQEPAGEADGLGDTTADDAAFVSGMTGTKGKRTKAPAEADPFALAA
jgi:uncharacterized protein (DUF736 family)